MVWITILSDFLVFGKRLFPYDYGSALTKFVRGRLAEVKSRSTGTEIYFDTKIWNSLPVSIGFRYTRLLDKDLLNPNAVNRWEIIIPINLIPN